MNQTLWLKKGWHGIYIYRDCLCITLLSGGFRSIYCSCGWGGWEPASEVCAEPTSWDVICRSSITIQQQHLVQWTLTCCDCGCKSSLSTGPIWSKWVTRWKYLNLSIVQNFRDHIVGFKMRPEIRFYLSCWQSYE